VAGFSSESWPASNRNGGRHQIGIPGRIASEFALETVMDASNAPSRDLVSGDFGTLLHTFYSTIDEQARRRGKPEPCPFAWSVDCDKTFALDVASSVLDAGRMALQDHLAGRARFLTCSAPTGAGKSSYAWAMVAAVVEAYPEASVVFACETIQQCEATYWGLREVMDLRSSFNCPKPLSTVKEQELPDLVVWTGGHDANKSWDDIKRVYPTFTPTVDPSTGRIITQRFQRSDLETARVVVVTHNMLLKGEGENGRIYYGRPRTLTVVDEKINEVAMYDISIGDVSNARDWLAARFGGKTRQTQPSTPFSTTSQPLGRPSGLARETSCRWTTPRRLTPTGLKARRLMTSSAFTQKTAPSTR
jgi:hypothetical protein